MTIKENEEPTPVVNPDPERTFKGQGNISISGLSGSGKSWFADEYIIRPLAKSKNNMIIVDIKNQYEKVLGKKEIIIDVTDQDQLQKELWRYRKDKRFRIRIIPPRGLALRERDFILNETARFTTLKGNCYLIVEEFNYFLRDKVNIPLQFEDMMRLDTGPHNKNIYVVIISQFPTDIPKDIWGNIHTKIFFKQNEKLMMNLRNSSHVNYPYIYKFEKCPYPTGYQGQYYAE